MKFQPLTEEELQVQALIPDGTYNYKVIEAKERLSNAGNEYIALTLKVNFEGKEQGIFTNLALIKLLKHFCDVNGMQDLYVKGEVTDKDCLAKSGGQVVIGIEGEKPDGKGGMYRAKNIVKDYIAAIPGSLTAPLPAPLSEKKDSFEDDLPF